MRPMRRHYAYMYCNTGHVYLNLFPVPEAAPQNVNCTALSSQSLKISWLEPPLQFHGGIIQGYKILYRPIVHQSEYMRQVQ